MTDLDISIEPDHPAGAGGPAVSILGTGMLGTALARALLRAGHRVTVWNRTPGKADALVADGATARRTPVEAVAAGQMVITSVSTYDDVQAVLTPASDGLDGLAGRTLVNLSSGTPDQARSLAAWATEQGAAYLDGAAMSGTRLVGRPDALFLYSGDPDAFAASEAALASLGRPAYLGADPGAASVHDTALLMMNMGVLSGFYQAVALVGAAGVEAPAFAATATDYLPYATGLLADHARQIHEGRYTGDDGTLDVYVVAMGHVVDASRRLGVGIDIPATIKSLLEQGVAAGFGDDGLARLADVVAGR
jgi:3-hydroxyisobutyrate dehydrogenase-like beta-hydroxyacid dehydrogenase